jgi:hypothetical protein
MASKIANLELARIPERDRGEAFRRHGDNGQIENRIAADPLGL